MPEVVQEANLTVWTFGFFASTVISKKQLCSDFEYFYDGLPSWNITYFKGVVVAKKLKNEIYNDKLPE